MLLNSESLAPNVTPGTDAFSKYLTNKLTQKLMDGSVTFRGFYFINSPYASNIWLIRYHYVWLIFPNEAKTLRPKYWGNILPALPPSASSPIKTTYCVSIAPCALYSQYNYYDTKKKKKKS